jgi:uncharacterized repeat protein (TIGR03803 family)
MSTDPAIVSSLRAAETFPQKSSRSPQYATLYNFRGGKDGYGPAASLTVLNGTLYGTTQFGGNDSCYTTDLPGCGTIFAIEPSGKERVTYRFKGNDDGLYPLANLVAVSGKLYGTTVAGGNENCGLYSGCGIVFVVTTSGQERVIYRFGGEPDAAKPRAPLIVRNNSFFGTTSAGGSNSGGAIFAINTHGKEQVVAGFNDSYGGGPRAGLLDEAGVLYGTTDAGGASGDGAVFSATRAGKIALLHSFSGAPDGASPITSLVRYHGALYGTTSSGGNSCNCSTVFSLSADGKERVLHRFSGDDGSAPYAGLIQVGKAFYGTTKLGGAYGDGSVFEVTPSGKERVLYSFGAGGSSDGSLPVAGLLYWKGELYGTTSSGGAHSYGTVFRLSPAAR